MLKFCVLMSVVVMFMAFKWLGDSQDKAYQSCLAGSHTASTCRAYTY